MIAAQRNFADMLAPLCAAFDIIECADEVAWLKERDNGVGASEVAVLLGLCDWASPFSLWAQKTGRVPKLASDSEILEWGRFMEEPTAQRYAYRTKRELRDLGRWTILRSKQWPDLFCTLDRIIMHVPRTDEDFGLYPWQPFMVGPGPLEIKATTIYGYHNWDEGVPLHYQTQLQSQLAVTGWLWGSFGVQMPTGKFDAIDVERNDAFIGVVGEKSKAFMDCVREDRWPPLDGSSWTGAALKAMFPRDSGHRVKLPPESAQWDAELQESKAILKVHEARVDHLKNLFAGAIGDASVGELPSGDGYTYKAQSRAEHVVKASTFRVLRRAKI